MKPHPQKRDIEKSRTVTLHGLIWAAFGDRPRKGNEDIDHIDGDKTNNRIDNLRLLTRSENMVAYHKRVGSRGSVRQLDSGMWEARFQKNKQPYNLGNYTTARDARTAIKAFLRIIDYEI